MRFIQIIILVIFATLVSCSEKEVIDYDAKDQQLIEQYLQKHNLTAQKTESGLHYIIDKAGGEAHPIWNSTVKVFYTGYLLDSTEFDKTKTDPVVLDLKNVLKGFQEGLQHIGVGGEIRLFIPSNLAYGANSTDKIPEHSVLIFDINLVEFY